MTVTASPLGLPVHEATTAEERDQIWRFRHGVYVQELGRKLGRDAVEEAWVHDPEDDQPYTIHFYAQDDQGISGVVRLRHWKPGQVPEKDFELFSMERFPGIENLTTGEVGRLMVRPDERNTLVLGSLLATAYEIGAGRLDCDLAFLNCAPGLVRLYRRLGARPYDGRLVPTPDGIEVPMVIVMSDLATFEQAGSFLLPIARQRFGPDGKPPLDVGRFRHLFEVRGMPVDIEPGIVRKLFEEQEMHEGRNFFDALSPETLDKLSSEDLVLSIPAGALLFEMGLAQRELFVVVDGLFEVLDGDRRRFLLHQDDVIGEMAFFSTAGRRTASVRAVVDSRVVVLRHRFVEKLRRRDPACAAELLFELARVLADRAAST